MFNYFWAIFVQMRQLFFRIFVLLGISFVATSCHVARFFYYNFADVKDYQKFAADTVYKGKSVFYFEKASSQIPFSLPSAFQSDSLSFDSFLEKHKTLAFLVIKNDTIVYEEYYRDYDSSSVIPSFSVSKVFVSALLGIAIQNGCIESVHDSISKYIPELQHKGFDQLSLLNLLNMRSGLDFKEAYTTPFADMAKYYYGQNLKKYVSKLTVEEKPGARYNYQSVNTLLLGIAIENACNKRLPELLSDEIWSKIGTSYNASWSVDSKKHHTTKAFCCINATPKDFGKFGSLYLHEGNWNGEQIIPSEWVKRSTTIQNDSRDSQGYPYAYQWRVLKSGSYFAKGVLGQYIYINPTKKVVIVRMGKSTDDINWPRFFESLLPQL